MIIIHTYVDEKTSKVMLDFGVDCDTDQVVILPYEPLNCEEQGIEYCSKTGLYFAKE